MLMKKNSYGKKEEKEGNKVMRDNLEDEKRNI